MFSNCTGVKPTKFSRGEFIILHDMFAKQRIKEVEKLGNISLLSLILISNNFYVKILCYPISKREISMPQDSGYKIGRAKWMKCKFGYFKKNNRTFFRISRIHWSPSAL